MNRGREPGRRAVAAMSIAIAAIAILPAAAAAQKLPAANPLVRPPPAAPKPAEKPAAKPAAPKPAEKPAAPGKAAEPPGDGSVAYGTHGFLDRLSKGTDEVERCRPRTSGSDRQLTERAADHYDRGVVLYEQGDYQAAVREFVVAYCDKPHPSMFYNIGQAYERMLDFERAVAYFERFILDSDEREPNRKRAAIRVDVLRGLPARILVATVPPGGEVTLSGETGVTARARANGSDPIEVRKGVYTMRVELAGHEPVVQRVVAEIGQPYSYYFRLEPKKGVVRVAATPPDARIFLNNRLVGIGSYLETVPIGRYRLLVEAEGRPPRREALEVSAGRTTDVTVNLPDRARSGRWELIIASGLVLGSASGGMADTLFDQGSVATSLISAGGLGIGFGAAFLGVPSDIPVGYSSYLIGSTVIGALEGAMITSIFAGKDCFTGTDDPEEGEEPIDPIPSDCQDGTVGSVAIAAGAAGLLFSALTASTFDLDAGDAALINSGAMWGTASGLLFWASFDTDEDVLEPMILAGLNLGVVVGAVLAPRAEVSRGRVALIDLSGLGGTVAGFALGEAVDTNNERLSHFALVGMATGLIAGTWLTRFMDEPKLTIQPGVTPTLSGDGATASLGFEF
jgi:tetratricopeptide (TPR) repeat protein